MPTKGYRTPGERQTHLAGVARRAFITERMGHEEQVAAAEAVSELPERPNQMSFGEQVVEAIGEHIDARISYAKTRNDCATADWANPDEVNKTGERLQALLDKVRFAL